MCRKPKCDGCCNAIRHYLSERYKKWREIKKVGLLILRDYEGEANFIGFCSLLLGDFARRNNLIVECRVRDNSFLSRRILYLYFKDGSKCHVLEICEEEKKISFSWHLPI
jgi:hypothetical protein